MATSKRKRRPISKRLKITAITVGSLLGILVCVVLINVIISVIQTDHEHDKLLDELSSLHLSSSKPITRGFNDEPINTELLLSDTHPVLYAELAIKQTLLGQEIKYLKSVLQGHQFTVRHDPQYAPTYISGTTKNYSVYIGLEYNWSDPPLVNTGQKSSFNGEPIFATPASTKINGLLVNIEDFSATNSAIQF